MKKLSYLLIGMGMLSVCACTKPIDACFSTPVGALTTNEPVLFDASCTQNASTYTWSFGDNFSDTTVTSTTILHKYSASGSYIVSLAAQRKDGKTSGKDKIVFQKTITIQ